MVGCFFDRVTALGLNFVGDNLTKITSNYTSVVMGGPVIPGGKGGVPVLCGRGSRRA